MWSGSCWREDKVSRSRRKREVCLLSPPGLFFPYGDPDVILRRIFTRPLLSQLRVTGILLFAEGNALDSQRGWVHVK